MKESSKVKVWLTCPETHADKVRMAIGDAGIGKIGNYTHCSFVTNGKGYFKPAEGSNPNIGEQGVLQEVAEMVIEFVCEKEQVDALMAVLKDNHPYEEVAIDFFPLLEQ